MTGTHAERPQIKKLIATLFAGDLVIIAPADRLLPDTTDLLVIARDIHRAGAGLRSRAEFVVGTTSQFTKLTLAMLRVAATLERRRIMMPIARGRADAKANGVRFGRKPSLTPHLQQEARKRIDTRETPCSPGDDFNVGGITEVKRHHV